MSLAAGARLGPYEILGAIGAGGMGEVYKARDTRGLVQVWQRDAGHSLPRRVKTRYLYSMSTRLVNVRLDSDRLRKTERLRACGVALSDVVREAIDARYAALRRVDAQTGVKSIVKRIFEQYPDPPDLPPRPYNVHDRRAARRAVLRRARHEHS